MQNNTSEQSPPYKIIKQRSTKHITQTPICTEVTVTAPEI